jgi:hypothetical protein
VAGTAPRYLARRRHGQERSPARRARLLPTRGLVPLDRARKRGAGPVRRDRDPFSRSVASGRRPMASFPSKTALSLKVAGCLSGSGHHARRPLAQDPSMAATVRQVIALAEELSEGKRIRRSRGAWLAEVERRAARGCHAGRARGRCVRAHRAQARSVTMTEVRIEPEASWPTPGRGWWQRGSRSPTRCWPSSARRPSRERARGERWASDAIGWRRGRPVDPALHDPPPPG